MALLKPLLQKHSFTAQEAKKLGVSPSLLCHHVKAGRIRRLGRGVYQSSTYENPGSDFRWDDLIEAISVVPDGIVCLISALAVYELTDEIPRQHWIAIPHKKTFRESSELKIVRMRNTALGKTTKMLGGKMIPIFDQERTIVDSFRLLSSEIAIKALKMALIPSREKKLDLQKLQSYAKKLRINVDTYLMTVTT